LSAVENLFKSLSSLPVIPEVAMRAQQLLDDPDVHLGKLADVLSMDPVLAVRISRLADSPLYGARGANLSLRQAVQRLGIPETRRIVMTVAVMNAMPTLPEPMDMRVFWRLGLGTALVGRQLAEDIKFNRPEQAYLAGLVHTLGEATLAINRTAEFAKAFQRATSQHRELHAVLRETFGVSPEQLTAHMLGVWGFPREIGEAVEFYLDARSAPQQKLLASIVYAADRMCRGLGLAPEELGEGTDDWVDQIAPELCERFAEIGYADPTDYVLMRLQFMTGVEELIEKTFG
jgi:HD-like signal output (HDOD) protein